MRRHLLIAACLLASTASAQPPSDPTFLGGEATVGQIEARLRDEVPRRFRQVGTSSVTLRVDFQEGGAAFKPRTRSHPHGFQAELAAYRVARLLGMDNVPPVVTRELPRPLLDNRFEGETPEDWEPLRREILWDNPGVARGAAIYWVPNMDRTPLSTLEGLSEATPWLTVGGAIPEDAAPTARDLSTMIAYDYLIGNWDRFSGGNVSSHASGRLFVRDHNIAFQAPMTDTRYARIRGHLERVQRFSRSFVERVRGLSRESVASAVAISECGEPPCGSLLLPAQIDGVLARRRALLSYIGALAVVHGADEVLYWD